MNNEELKNKIAQIISEYCCSSGKTHKQLYGDDRMCYSKMNFAECNPITECTDALIAAGIGDTNDLEVRCEVLQRDVDNLTRTMEEGAEELKEAEHRAEKYERALELMARGECTFASPEYYLKQAEKELAEERKNG